MVANADGDDVPMIVDEGVGIIRKDDDGVPIA